DGVPRGVSGDAWPGHRGRMRRAVAGDAGATPAGESTTVHHLVTADRARPWKQQRMVLEQGPLRVEISLAPLSIHVRRAGRRLLRAVTVWACEGEVRDRFVQVTEGVIADERLGFPERA